MTLVPSVKISVGLESLPRDDVLFKLLLPKLDVYDWLSLQQTSLTLNAILDSFFAVNKDLKVLSRYTLSYQDFHRVSQLSTNLRSLVLQNCSWLTDDVLKPVLKNNPKLEVLDIADCVNCTSAILQVLTVNCPNISWLILRGCTWVDPNGLDYFSNHRNSRKKADDIENVLMSMGKGLRTNLKKRTKAKYKGKDQLFESLQTLQRGENSKRSPSKLKTAGNLRFKNVAVIDLHGCGKVTDDNIEILTSVFKHLEVLRIGNNFDISDKAMRSIALNLKFLRSLDISCCLNVTDAGLFTVTKHCSKLKEVNIDDSQFTPEILNLLAEKDIKLSRVWSVPSGQHVSHKTDSAHAGGLLDCFDGVILGMGSE